MLNQFIVGTFSYHMKRGKIVERVEGDADGSDPDDDDEGNDVKEEI